MESRAMLPTTRRVMKSHPVWSGDAKKSESVRQYDAGSPRQQQPSLLGLGRLSHRAGAVIPPVDQGGELVEVDGDPVRLAFPGRFVHHLRKLNGFLQKVT